MTSSAKPAYASTLPALLQDRVERYGNREFFRFEGQSFGFEDISRAARGVAQGLIANGVNKGDKVAILMSNRPEYIFAWFGIAMIGAVEVPLNTAHKGSLLTYMMRQSDARIAIVESDFYHNLEAVASELDKLERILLLADTPLEMTQPTLPVSDYHQICTANTDMPGVAVNPSDPTAIMFTSGTTGPSKGAVIPQNYPLYIGTVEATVAQYTEDDCLYNALPLFHGNAQFLSTLPAMISGARMVLARRFSASSFWADIKHHGCTEFNYIGGIIPILMKAEPRADDADNPLRVMVGAGAPKDLSAAFEQRFGVRLVEGYGMSEIGIPITNTLQRRKLGSCGFHNPDYDILLVSDDGQPVGDEEPGELLVRPRQLDSMMIEYYNMPEKTVETWQNLWFHTGDYLKRDSEGYYYFLDRKKDALRRRGENISSYEVEREINQIPEVLESAAIAVKSELGEDEVMVVVCLKPGQELTPPQIIQHCEANMAYFMVPRFIRFIDTMPKTPTERIQKFVLRDAGVTNDTYDREYSQ